jgi:shikimate kinase
VTGSRTIVLIGPMGAGKSSVGRRLAVRLHRPLFDTDDIIRRALGTTGAKIAERAGIAYLHDLEASIFDRALQRSSGAVIPAAASIVDDPERVERLRDGREFVALLTASPEECTRRISLQTHRRSTDHDERYALFERRLDSFRRAADVQIDTTSLDIDEVTELVVNALWVSWP